MSTEKKTSQASETIRTAMKGLKHILLHNGLLKVIAILISVVLWAGLISQDDTITRDKSFQNVNVSITGADTMKNSGYIVVSDLNKMLEDVSIVAAVPQKQYENADPSAYYVRIDLSKINGTGEQEVKLQSSNSTTYGKVISTSPSSINVMVDDYIVRQRIPVSFSLEGEVPEGWYMTTPAVDPTVVAVSGPRSIVQGISRAKAVIDAKDIEWTEGMVVLSAALKLYNRAGDEVNSPLVGTTTASTSIDSVLIETTLLPEVAFETTDLIQVNGNVARGYEIKEVKVSPESITVAAREEVLEQMSELPMERTVNVRNLNETSVFQLKVQKPSDDAFISNETVTVTVEIGPVTEQ